MKIENVLSLARETAQKENKLEKRKSTNLRSVLIENNRISNVQQNSRRHLPKIRNELRYRKIITNQKIKFNFKIIQRKLEILPGFIIIRYK